LARYSGRKGLVYLSTSGTAAATSFTPISAWTLDAATDRQEVTAFGDANKVYIQGLQNVQGTFTGFFDDTTSANLFTAAASADGVKLYLYPSSDAITKYAYGPAWLDASINVSVGGAITVNGSFAASGSWGLGKL
jgi:hypothetical protein